MLLVHAQAAAVPWMVCAMHYVPPMVLIIPLACIVSIVRSAGPCSGRRRAPHAPVTALRHAPPIKDTH